MTAFDKVSDSTHDAYDKVASAGNRVVDVLGEKGDQLRSTEQQLVKDCRSYISHNPITSVGIAAAVGFLLSRLTSRR
jgi:ElaB/YqjD/DUF883 family membrane-anchored ribosome-binding protein